MEVRAKTRSKTSKYEKERFLVCRGTYTAMLEAVLNQHGHLHGHAGGSVEHENVTRDFPVVNTGTNTAVLEAVLNIKTWLESQHGPEHGRVEARVEKPYLPNYK